MWLNRCGANADSRFMGIPDYLDGPSFSGRLAFGQALEFPSSLGSRRVPVPPRDSYESQESGFLKASPPVREELLNLHRMIDFRRVPGTVRTWEDRLQPGKPPASTPRRAVRRRQGTVAKTADLSRRPEIQKPAPIGQFVEFLRRAGLTKSLRMERKRVPSGILSEADRLECLFSSGFDPHIEGNEPPGL